MSQTDIRRPRERRQRRQEGRRISETTWQIRGNRVMRTTGRTFSRGGTSKKKKEKRLKKGGKTKQFPKDPKATTATRCS
ncbi:hypothetical protein RRG08_058091 [Elysia crispata]|uniref:Uncharacterized protein n=1 Tax=Elysia crispata TaxID=231223 RepID=A0AAE0YGX6_9GAST|nr:hypothetical protein RRG08_058091 [Elysia crispata]